MRTVGLTFEKKAANKVRPAKGKAEKPEVAEDDGN